MKIRSAPLIELRESEEEHYRVLESEILKKMILVWNTHADEHGEGELPDDLKVNVIYNRPDDSFESTQDKIASLTTLRAQGLIKLTEIIMELKPSFTKEDAEKYLEEVIEENRRFGKGVSVANQRPVPGSDEERDLAEEEVEQNVSETVRNAINQNPPVPPRQTNPPRRENPPGRNR